LWTRPVAVRRLAGAEFEDPAPAGLKWVCHGSRPGAEQPPASAGGGSGERSGS